MCGKYTKFLNYHSLVNVIYLNVNSLIIMAHITL